MNTKIKSVFSWLLKLFIAGLISIIILSIFVFVYNYEGVHIKTKDGSTDYKWEPGQFKSQMVEGFSFFKMDSNGYNNIEFIEMNPDILLMGSSHIEAVELMQKDNVASLLNKSLPEMTTYNIGTSGHTIYRCADNFQNAIGTYFPNKYVIIETDRVNLDINSMMEVINGNAKPIPSYDSGLMYYMQKIPAVKMIYNQIDKWLSTSSDISFGKPFRIHTQKSTEKNNTEIPEEYTDTLSEFLNIISSYANDYSVKPIIFYQPSETLNNDGSVTYSTDEAYLNAFAEECKNQNIIFVDMTKDFEKLYNEEHIMAHGFSNTAVGVGHMNKFAHSVVAKRLKNVIKNQEDVK